MAGPGHRSDEGLAQMTAEDLRFKEIEHKYIVDERFDVQRFRDVVATLGPTRTGSIRVRDRYFLTEAGRARRFVIRHRYDVELHHLTVKTLDADTEVRVEVNLDLGHHAGDQQAQVDAFLSQLGVEWSGTVHKDLEVWNFPDCEVVYYQASTDRRSVRCVEFEATRKESLTAALATVEKYERATGFERTHRSRQSLLAIMFPEVTELLGC
jgi:adenylate cyclase class IV